MAKTKKLAIKKVAHKANSSTQKTVLKRSLADFDAPMRSFRVSRDTLPFFGIRITRQTVYWVILMAFIMIMQLSILIAQLNIFRATDSITSLL